MMHNISWVLVEAGTSTFEIILLFTYLNGFLPSKEVARYKKIIAFFAAAIIQILVSVYFYNEPNVLIINYCTLAICCALLLYTGKPLYRIFSGVLLVAVLVVVELIAICIIVMILNIELPQVQGEPSFKLIAVMIKNILSFALIKLITNFRKSNLRETGRAYFALLMIVPLICLIISLLILELVIPNGPDDMTMVLIACLGLMYVNAVVFTIFESLLQELDKTYTYKLIEKQLELQLNHYNKLAENRAILSETIHDFKNHLNCIYNLYKYNNHDELGRYLESLVNVSDSEKVIDTGNPVIDALLNDKYNLARKLGIEFKKELNLPSNLKIAPADICVVLGNSLDNAIEACKRIRNPVFRREITLSMAYYNSYLVIVVVNTIDQKPEKEGRFFRSSKPNPELHGLGLQSIERTVKKYDGNMVFDYDDPGLFKLQIVLSTA
jgi:signal transduction histidine kinase